MALIVASSEFWNLQGRRTSEMIMNWSNITVLSEAVDNDSFFYGNLDGVATLLTDQQFQFSWDSGG